MAEIRTWRRGSGLINWTYNLGDRHRRDRVKQLLADPVQRQIWIGEKIERLLDALKNFALVQDVTVDTWTRGEETFIIEDWRGDESRSKLLNFLQQTDDVVNIDFTLTLQCLTPGIHQPQELLIKYGGNIFVFVELDDEGKLDTTADTPIWLIFSLDVDIYAHISWGQERDNAKLAELNGCRLSAFLQRLEQNIPLEFLGVDATDYQEMVERYGFLAVSWSKK